MSRALRSISVLLILLLLQAFSGCRDEKVRDVSFYYWRTAYDVSASTNAHLKELGVNTLYLRYFDVVPDEASGSPVPNSIVSFNVPVLFKIVPVVYIRNDVFLKGTDEVKLAHQVYKLVSAISASNKIPFSQIQVDCDWSGRTRESYFLFLRKFKELSGKMVTCTIRLHQLKYKSVTGVPPVDRGALMFYNMGQVQPDKEYMFSKKYAEGYLDYLENYPLALDYALPFYDHAIRFRDGHATEIIKPDVLRSHYKCFTKEKGQWHADSSFLYEGVYVKKGDVFRIEDSRNETVVTAARMLSSYSGDKGSAIIFFDVPKQTAGDEVFKSAEEAVAVFN